MVRPISVGAHLSCQRDDKQETCTSMTAEIKQCLCVRQCSIACPHLLQMPLMLEHWLYSHTCPRGPPSQQCQRLHAHLSSIPLSLRLNLLSSISSSTCSCGCKNKHGGSLRAVKHHRVTAKLKHLIKGRLTSLSGQSCIQAALDALQGLAVHFLCLYRPGFALLAPLSAEKGNTLYSSSKEGDCTKTQWSAQVSRV